MPIHFYWNWTFEINPTDSIFLASNIQIFIVVYLHINSNISTDVKYLWLHLHINSNISTDVKYLWLLLSLCSLSYYSSSACLEVLQSVYGRFPPHFTLVINCLKLQFDQSLSITSLVILLRIRSIRLLDWSPRLPGSFTVLRVPSTMAAAAIPQPPCRPTPTVSVPVPPHTTTTTDQHVVQQVSVFKT